ncbi:MAG: ABC transporter ATP-binding protein [Clostridia bacterium]|nr:ABC transporter ATP-binding protein [Clostridia bacterium]
MTGMAVLKKVMSRMAGYKVQITLSILLAVVTVGLTLLIPVLLGRAIDLIIGAGDVDFEGIVVNLTFAAVAAILNVIGLWVMNVVNNRLSYDLVKDIRAQSIRKIQRLPLGYIDTHPAGDIVSRVISDADRFMEGLLLGMAQLFTGITAIIGTLAIMLAINARIALVVLLVTPLSLIVAAYVAKNTYDMFTVESRIRAEQTGLIDETINGQKVVVAFGREEYVKERFDEINRRLEKCSIRAIFFSSITNPSTRFVNAIVYASVAVLGALSVIGGGLSVGMLTCFLSYANQYTKPFNEISGVIAQIQNALACAGRIFEFLEAEEEVPDGVGAVSIDDCRGDVDIKDVSFGYEPGKALIKDMNLHIKSGMRAAIVGPTGCGKTTLINLLMRFYDVNGGSISVDGKCIREITRQSLRRNYGMVLQDTWIMPGTIRENVAFGKPDATDEEIIAACKASHAHSFITRLPNGYDTVMDEQAQALSQGERQLLCIARVMLDTPPMLILDEATSSIDTRTELKIQDSFAKMMKGRTSFIVAHRLSTIREADVIIVMRDGDIVEQGTHDELMERKGFYYELFMSQFAQSEV